MELNKIYNQDCLEGMKQIPDSSVDLVVTDPPYGMGFVSNMRKNKYDAIANDDNLDFLPKFLDQTKRVMKDSTAIYCFCSWHNVDVFKRELEARFSLKNLLVWVKPTGGMGDLECGYSPAHEFCFYASKGHAPKLNGKREPDVLQFSKTGNKLHPTQKPVELMRYLVQKSSQRGGVYFGPVHGLGNYSGGLCA